MVNGVIYISRARCGGDLDGNPAPVGVSIDIIASVCDDDPARGPGGGDEIDVREAGGAGAAVLGGSLHSPARIGRREVALVEGAVYPIGQREGNIAQVPAGPQAADAVEVFRVELEGPVGRGGVGHVLGLLHVHLNGPLKKGCGVGIACVGDDGGAAEISLGHKGDVREVHLAGAGIEVVVFAGAYPGAGVGLGLVTVVEGPRFGVHPEAADIAQGAAQHIPALPLDPGLDAGEGKRIPRPRRGVDDVGGVALHLDLTGGGIAGAVDLGGDGDGTFCQAVDIAVVDPGDRGLAAGPLHPIIFNGCAVDGIF